MLHEAIAARDMDKALHVKTAGVHPAQIPVRRPNEPLFDAMLAPADPEQLFQSIPSSRYD
jgi:hypothetical protein